MPRLGRQDAAPAMARRTRAFSDGTDAAATFAMEFSHFEKKADKDF
jgi:hypothetical protein